MVQSFASEAKSQKVKLLLDIGDSLLQCQVSSIKTDHVRLGQIVTNLISNAMKFTTNSARREITVHYDVAMFPPEDETCAPPEVSHRIRDVPAEDTPVWLFVSVTDSGPGLASAERENLFKRFSREYRCSRYRADHVRGKQDDPFAVRWLWPGIVHLPQSVDC